MKRLSAQLVGPVIAVLMILSMGVASAGAAGTGPPDAQPISGTMTGRLDSPQTYWYQFTGDGSSPVGVTLDFVAADGSNPAGVYFHVDWATAQGVPGADWPGLYRFDRSSTYSVPGVRYWSQSTSVPTTYYVEVVNNAGLPIAYAIGLTGATFPPPTLALSSSGGPAVEQPAAAPPAPSPAPPPNPVTQPNTATDQSGLIVDPQIQVGGTFSSIFVRVDSASATLIKIDRVLVRPPPGAVVDGVVPYQTAPEDGIVWYTTALVNKDNPLVGYMVRFWGPANGAVVEIDWSTSTDKGALSVTIAGAPAPVPPGS